MKTIFVTGLLSICMVFFLSSSISVAQENEEKAKLVLDLSYHQTNEELPILKVFSKSRIEKKFRPVKEVYVNFFLGEENSKGFIGRTMTNEDGMGEVEIPAKFKELLESESLYYFIATVTEDEKFLDTSSEIEINKAKVEITYGEGDEEKSITAKVLAKGDSGWIEVPEVEVKFIVDRYFKFLLISEDYFETDEFGEVSANFEISIPGDKDGNINVGVKIEENELYGNLTFTESKKWGTATLPEDSFSKRTLWATRDKAPIWLLGLANVIIISVWIVIFYLVYQVFLIRKIGKSA